MFIVQPIDTEKVVLGFTGQNETELQGIEFSLYNHGVFDEPKALTLGSDSFRYVITTKSKLIEYFVSLGLLKFDIDRIVSQRTISWLRAKAEKTLNNFPVEYFYRE